MCAHQVKKVTDRLSDQIKWISESSCDPVVAHLLLFKTQASLDDLQADSLTSNLQVQVQSQARIVEGLIRANGRGALVFDGHVTLLHLSFLHLLK